jgi:hypothetical protein
MRKPNKNEIEIKVPVASDVTQEQRDARILPDITVTVVTHTVALESKTDEINTTVAPEANIAQNASQSVTGAPTEYQLPIGVSMSKPTNDSQMIKNGWGNPIQTTVVTIKKSFLRETVVEALYIATLGGTLDTSFLPTMTCPFICRALLPDDKYQEYLERKSQNRYDESQEGNYYNEVLVKGVDRPSFWKSLFKVGNTGAFIKPNCEPTRSSPFMIKLLTRKAVVDTIATKLSPVKAIYTKEELEEFTIEDLHIIGGWYNMSFNSKQKYIKAILEVQNVRFISK